ncbi:MAG: FdtA/QdtA family cupin domain-containing protein [Patescibacteria group bacterium]|nr:FdtA/QdtA family cupin domain-containing protein [Patescibacteria group bacterium]
MQVQKLHFDVISGRRAYEMLFVEHYKENVPFEVKKTYFLFGGSLATASGQHCHYKEEEVFVCLRGSVQFITIDEQGQDVLIDMQPGDAVYVPNYAWHGFPVVGPDSVVVALSSEHYAEDRSDYLEDKQCFLDNKYYQKYKKQEINIFDVWNLEKKRIHGSQRKVNVKPGQIWMTKLGVNIGNEQNGQGKHMRPFLIIKKIGSLVF